MLIVDAEVEGRAHVALRTDADRIVALGPSLVPRAGETVIDAAGGVLLPGLHDHHIHLLALAAAASSVHCGAPQVQSADTLGRALSAASADSAADGRGGSQADWIRGVGYHESVAGPLDRDQLDTWVSSRPLRIQHRTGAMWILNSVGVGRLGLDDGVDLAGVERDVTGRATGRLFDLDAWLRAALGSAVIPDLEPVGRMLAGCGVTGVTDATATNSAVEWNAFADAAQSGALRQRIVAMGQPDLAAGRGPISLGAVKVLLTERALIDFDQLVGSIGAAHDVGRSVAIHCVTRAELVFAVSAFDASGARPGDRIEHASVAPPDVLERLARLPLTVVTQPTFLRERGDSYAVDVEPRDRPWLYRGRGFLRMGVPLGGGTDAPYGSADPWRAMAAAVSRRTVCGRVMGESECLSPEQALALFTTPAEAPGGAPRRVAIGERADLCLLDRSWAEARENLDSALVAATISEGTLTFRVR
ncbi:MAG: amidohydrolase family protein [Myxococcota bacterium]